jgi:CheY-like chemotaxis protein
MLQLLNDILDFSKIEAGRVEIERLRFSPRRLAEETAAQWAEAAQGKGLELVCRIAPDVPDAAWGDAHRLRQCLGNLLSNAVKFTHEGEIVVEVDVLGAGTGERLRLGVADTGVGIPLEAQPHVFHAFSQADNSTTRKYGGTGLGLTITRQLAELMGGAVEMDSRVGAGTRMALAIPLERAGAEPAPPSPLAAGTPVWVVEPNRAARAALVADLRRLGANVREMADTAQAHDRLAAGDAPPAIVVYAEPPFPGRDSPFARAVLALPAAARARLVKLVPLATLAELDIQATPGVDAWAPKPVTDATLRQALGEAAAGAAAAPGTAPTSMPARAPAARLRVLLAEDNVVNAEIAVELLRDIGCEVVHAGDGEAALGEYGRGDFDVVLMDCQMPRMDGFAATRALRRIESDRGAAGASARRTPVIALTANALNGDRERCIAAGMDDHVAKPFSRAQLREAILRWADPVRLADRAEPEPVLLREAPAVAGG